MRADFLAGVRASVPACLGVVPGGITIRLLAVQSGLSVGDARLTSATGSAAPRRATALFCAPAEPFEASRRALKLSRRAAALAEKDSASAGPYSFRTAFMDWLAELHSEEEKNVR